MSTAASDNDSSANPWLPLCLARLAALDDPSIPLTEVKVKYTQELRWIEEAKSAVRSQLNTHSPIARLVPEVLAHVFRMLTDIDMPHANTWITWLNAVPMKEPSLGWIQVTHVCRSWRNVALDHPDLWGRHDVCSLPYWTEEWLRRSKEAPLNVSLLCGFWKRLRPSMVANAYRVRCVTFYSEKGFSWETADKSWHDFLRSSAVSLESLTYIFDPGESWATGAAIYHDTLPADILGHKAPHLKCLSLSQTLIPFDSPIYDNLAHLSLNYMFRLVTGADSDRPAPFPREEFLALLLRMPKLETLALYQAIPDEAQSLENVEPVEPDAHSPSPTPGSVTLPLLESLTLRDSQCNYVWFAENLTIPAAASLGIDCIHRHGRYPLALTSDALLQFLIRHSGQRDCLRPPIQTMSFILDATFAGWTFLCWKELVHDVYPFITSTDQRSRCHVRAKISGPFLHGTLRTLLTRIHTSNIRVLSICSRGEELGIEWPDCLELFAPFTALEYFTLDDSIAFHFIQAFGLDLGLNLGTNSTTEDPPQVLFPNLRCLKFCLVYFDCLRYSADALLSELMIEALTERQTMNTKLEEIYLFQCRRTQRWVDALERMGLKVLCEDKVCIY